MIDAPALLRRARERSALTQTELAERAGTSQAAVSAYENGHKEPSLATLARLLAANGSRLEMKPAERPVIEVSRERHVTAARILVEVLGLAEALPTRHEPTLRYPPLIARSP